MAFSGSNRLATCLLGILLIALPAFSGRAGELPDLGNSASRVLSPVQEYELGLSVMKELQAASMISNDVVVTEYLQGLGYRLIATQGQPQHAFQFFAVNDGTINAFALPGGFVGVNLGLILATESESELAGVLAHEVGHVQQKHIARMYEHMDRLRISTIAGMIAAVILATQNGQAGSGAMAAALAGQQQALINFTRDHEKEADYVGIQSLAKAGFDPMGMPAFFHRMYQETRYNGSYIPEYLLTHPLTEARLMASQARAKNFPYRQVPDSLQYHLVQARVRVESFATAHEASAYFSKMLAKGNYRSRTGTLYGYVLALLEDKKPLVAKPYLDELLSISPNQPLFQLAYAQMEMAISQPQQALSRLSQALNNHPSNFPLLTTYSEWLIKSGNAHQAITLLKRVAAQKSSRAELWNLLSAAYAQTKQPVQSHIAHAQFLKLRGDFPGAMIQLRLAKKLTPISDIEKNQIDAQMKELQTQMAS